MRDFVGTVVEWKNAGENNFMLIYVWIVGGLLSISAMFGGVTAAAVGAGYHLHAVGWAAVAGVSFVLAACISWRTFGRRRALVRRRRMEGSY